MKKVFKAKISYTILAAVYITALSPLALEGFDANYAIISAILLVPVTLLFFGIRYIIEGDNLIVRIVFFNQTYPINQISHIRPTRSILSAPAPSLDRLAIGINKWGEELVISPADKEGFIEAIREVNKNIKVE